MEGKIIDNRYEILEQVDKGGTSFVYRAVDRKTKNIVAVKVLRSELSKKRDFIHRFETEVTAALSLEHNNIVHVLDAGHTEETYYLVMEFIEGKTLKQIIKEQGALDLHRAVDITIKVCNALHHAHSAGFVHRDVKPQNIMITKDEQVKITDFGIARNTAVLETKNKKNIVIGSVQYIPPEQAKGERTDRRTDIYSLGISLYEMITGNLPFEGETSTEVALKHLNEPIPYPKSKNNRINDALNKIVLKATRKNKRLRYSNATAFADDLKKCFERPGGEYVKLEREHMRTHTHKDHKKIRNRVIRSIATVGIFALAVAGVLVLLAAFGTRNNTDADLPAPVVAPSFVGLNELEATLLAENSNVQIGRLYSYSYDIPEGDVMGQEPAAGVDVPSNSTIDITFSLGIEMVTIPDLLDLPQEDARDILTELNMQIGDIEFIESDEPEGYIVAQDPIAGELLPIDEPVNLTVSKVIDLTKSVVPDFSGMHVDEVKEAFNELEFTKCYAYLEPDEAGGAHKKASYVLNQTPYKDTEEDIANPIYLWVGAYEENFYIIKTFELQLEQSDALVRVTIGQDESPIEYVMLEEKMDKGKHTVLVELNSFEAKEKYMSVYVNEKIVIMSVLSSWGRKEQ